ncbi:MAG: hypothetical protein QOC81_2895 [Thermoanaerobaculia bacterium]|jgi:hypothetical protein|nr:hypothetical protein [Thermoanaerobaculia bacterium]
MSWDADAAITLAQGLITLLMAALGYFVSTRPVNTEPRKRRFAEVSFIVLGVSLFALIGVQVVRAAHAKRRSDKRLAASQGKLDTTFQALLKSNANGERSQHLNVQLLQSLLDKSNGISTSIQQQRSELDQQAQSLQTIVKIVGVTSPTHGFSKRRPLTPAITTADYKVEPFFLNGHHIPHAYVFTPSISPPEFASSTWVNWDFGDGSPGLIEFGTRAVSHEYKDDKPYVVQMRISPIDDRPF